MSGATVATALHVLTNKLNLNSNVLASVIFTTALTVIFFEKYAQKKLPTDDGFEKTKPLKEIHFGWYAGLIAMEIYNLSDQFPAGTDFDAIDAVFASVLNLSFNILIFFVCYGVLGLAGVDKENLYERCKKAFMGLVILSFALLILAGYALVTQDASNQNVPAVTQEVQAEFVMTLNGENIFIDINTLVRTNNTNEDVAPEFKCVLIDTAEVRTNCEFTLRRGVVLMYVDGVEVGNSVENPDVEKLYNAIVKKFL